MLLSIAYGDTFYRIGEIKGIYYIVLCHLTSPIYDCDCLFGSERIDVSLCMLSLLLRYVILRSIYRNNEEFYNFFKDPIYFYSKVLLGIVSTRMLLFPLRWVAILETNK